MQDTTEKIAGFSLPKRLGVASDLVFIVRDPAGYLADCLITYDEIVVPLDLMSSGRRLEAAFDTKGLVTLMKEGRLRFCPGLSYGDEKIPERKDYSKDSFFTLLEKKDVFGPGVPDGLIQTIYDTLLSPVDPNYSDWKTLAKSAEDTFSTVAARPEYDSFFRAATYMERYTGLHSGLARMNDLAAVGVTSMEMDGELAALLQMGFPALSAPGLITVNGEEGRAIDVIEQLHKIDNLPLLSKIAHQEGWSTEKLIEVVLSDDAAKLREWLHMHVSPGVDVRDAYYGSLNALPSKKAWTGWLRFGTTSGISTAVAALLAAHPIAGAAAGLLIGAADLAAGEKAVEATLDGYHPAGWLSYLKRETP